MLDEVQLLLTAAWPTVLSIGVVLTSLVLWRRAATAHPNAGGHRARRPRGVLDEPRQGAELPQWRGVRR